MANWFPTMHHNDQSSFTSKEVDEKLEERVNCECFVYISYGINVECRSQRDKAAPGRYRIYRDPVSHQSSDTCPSTVHPHKQYTHNVSLQKRFPVILPTSAVNNLLTFCGGCLVRLKPYRPIDKNCQRGPSIPRTQVAILTLQKAEKLLKSKLQLQ